MIVVLSFGSVSHVKAQKTTYPNELKGYEFYNKGKLAGIRLGEATKEDVEKVFGGDCSDQCDLDERWRVSFEYFGDFSRSVGDGKSMWDVVPKSRFIGKVYSIVLSPKTKIPFNENDFSHQFNQSGVGASTSHRDKSFFYLVFEDEYGLSYRVFDRIEERGKEITSLPTESSTKGDLVEIKYELPDKRQKQIWIKKN